MKISDGTAQGQCKIVPPSMKMGTEGEDGKIKMKDGTILNCYNIYFLFIFIKVILIREFITFKPNIRHNITIFLYHNGCLKSEIKFLRVSCPFLCYSIG